MMLDKWLEYIPYFNKLQKKFFEIDDAIDNLRSQNDIPDDLFLQFQKDRQSKAYQSAFTNTEPLVSICIATYNRETLLTDRCLKSLVAQDYRNIEIIVVGDGCIDGTEERVLTINDPRIHFFNLPQRGDYPLDPYWRWMVAGTTAINYALDMAQGDFITHLDDDDEHSLDRISKLLRFIQNARVDVVWHPFWRENLYGKWQLRKTPYFRQNQVTTSSIFYHGWLKRLHWDINAYKYREPGDWNRLRKFVYLGCTSARFPEPLLKHYKERQQD